MRVMNEVVIVSACRAAIGGFQGSLSELPATTLGKVVILAALQRAGVAGSQVDEVILGNVLPAGLGQNPARQAMLEAELPFGVGALTVNKVCGAGLKAVMLAAQAIQAGDAEPIVAGGMESMTRAPWHSVARPLDLDLDLVRDHLHRSRSRSRTRSGKTRKKIIPVQVWVRGGDRPRESPASRFTCRPAQPACAKR